MKHHPTPPGPADGQPAPATDGLKQEQKDFTAEGAPPPGMVSGVHPPEQQPGPLPPSPASPTPPTSAASPADR